MAADPASVQRGYSPDSAAFGLCYRPTHAVTSSGANARGPIILLGTQAGSDLAVDADQRRQLLGSGFGFERQRLLENGQAEVGDVLLDRLGQGGFLGGGGGGEDGPQAAVVGQRVPQVGACLRPAIHDGLEA